MDDECPMAIGMLLPSSATSSHSAVRSQAYGFAGGPEAWLKHYSAIRACCNIATLLLIAIAIL